jgi:hypothetical protein
MPEFRIQESGVRSQKLSIWSGSCLCWFCHTVEIELIIRTRKDNVVCCALENSAFLYS